MPKVASFICNFLHLDKMVLRNTQYTYLVHDTSNLFLRVNNKKPKLLEL